MICLQAPKFGPLHVIFGPTQGMLMKIMLQKSPENVWIILNWILICLCKPYEMIVIGSKPINLERPFGLISIDSLHIFASQIFLTWNVGKDQGYIPIESNIVVQEAN